MRDLERPELDDLRPAACATEVAQLRPESAFSAGSRALGITQIDHVKGL
jgi:hypothetical protein